MNHLYEQARLSKLRSKTEQIMKYEFNPTMDWYDEQRKEGRGYELINVNTWEVIFNRFKIGSPI